MNQIKDSLEVVQFSQEISKTNSEDITVSKSQNKVCVKIQKPRKKRRIRLQWTPIIIRELQSDSDPIFIYNYLRMMKSYEDSEFSKFRNYGFQDAGIGIIESIQLDRVNESIDMSMYTVSEGLYNFTHLIKLYKSYQNQNYYDLAQALEDYQEWTLKNHHYLQDSIQHISQFLQGQLDVAEQGYNNFEKNVKQWADSYFQNEIYELVIGNLSVQQKMPVLKKQIFSKNLIYFMGSTLEKMYEDSCKLKNKDFLFNFMEGGYKSGMSELQKTIQTIRGSINEQLEYEIDDELFTFEGYQIPTKKKVNVFFHDLKTGEISKTPNLHFIIATTYSFEPHWIKFLIQKRSENQLEGSSFVEDLSLNNVYNLDYTCQKEYFLEKFYSNSQKQFIYK